MRPVAPTQNAGHLHLDSGHSPTPSGEPVTSARLATIARIAFIVPALLVIAVGIAGLLAFDTIGRAVVPVTAYCVLHLVETYVVTPFIPGRRFALNPVLIFIMLIFCTWLWGMIGALLAVPILVTAKVVFDQVPALNFPGDLLTPHDEGALSSAPPAVPARINPNAITGTPSAHTP